MSQFTFLQREWPDVLEAAGKAEAAVHADPRKIGIATICADSPVSADNQGINSDTASPRRLCSPFGTISLTYRSME
jgi:hypothetical protein